MKTLKLSKYSKFLNKFPDDLKDISRLAYTPYRYFYLAEKQIVEFLKYLNLIKDSQWKDDYSEECYSYAYGFYTLIRTSIKASGSFSAELQKIKPSKSLDTYRNKWHDDIQKIIVIADDKVVHPLDNDKAVKWYEPGGLDSNGDIDIYEWSIKDNNYFKVIKINPLQDIKTVHNYLEGLANIYLKIDSLRNVY